MGERDPRNKLLERSSLITPEGIWGSGSLNLLEPRNIFEECKLGILPMIWLFDRCYRNYANNGRRI